MLVSSGHEVPCARRTVRIRGAERTKGEGKANTRLDNFKILGLFVVESVPR
jgi:hypothetical protein